MTGAASSTPAPAARARVADTIRFATAAGCAAVAVAFFVYWLAGVADPVRMPTAPAPVAALAGAGAAVLLVSGPRSSRFRRGAVLLSAAVMFSGSLLALPHTILMVVVRAGQVLTDGSGSFSVEPSWSATAVHGLNLVATGLVVLWLVTDSRLCDGRCLRCGRTRAVPPPAPGRRLLRVLAVVAAVAALPYGLLKLGWSLGWDVGLTGTAFSDVSATSPGFGDTVVLTAVAILISVAMGAGAGSGALRWVLAAIGACGALMLLPVGLTAVTQAVPALWGGTSIDDSEIAPWAFMVVYVSFLLWGAALAWLTVTYWRATRPVCRAHTTSDVTDTVPTT